VTILPCDLGRNGLEQGSADGGFHPHRFSVALLFPEGHVVTRHEAAHEPRLPHLDACQPLDAGDAIPAWNNQAQGKSMGLGQWRAIHFITEQVVGVHGVLERHAARKMLPHFDAADFFFTSITADKDYLDALSPDLSLLQEGGKRCACPSCRTNQAMGEGLSTITSALERTDDLVPRAGFELTECESHRSID